MSLKSIQKRPIKDLLDREVEKPVLERLYIEHGVATGQLRRAPAALRVITGAFNQITSNNFDEATLLRYMFNRRKAKDWPRLGPKAKKFQSVLNLLSTAELEVLKQIYCDLDITSDDFLFKPDSIEIITRRFKELTGRKINGTILVSVIIAKRKRGLWVRIREPFADMEAIARNRA